MKTIIHVNQHKIKANKKLIDQGKTEGFAPVLTVKTHKSNVYANEAAIYDGDKIVGKIVYRPLKPLGCGAVCWIETDNKVEVII